ncbi:hypothetical protein SKUN_00538 [Spiroplasma kunkelii CR2-3x]|uniref:Transmembrane protein n=1 Tax=Spiroplasma kunkelii CR2-3x TaxID=273035 RepID=A0A0K2JG76_SPIKU|nr:hypothetical protein [Spiroplasma kunkelii]ALA97433.1 hypothetical protein SKUN_00538 [Spiroplasma kunkelii CR2-3x]
MLTKISSKRDELALQWNTGIEVAARLLVISFSILGTSMGYFISAGCAMAYNNIKNLTGVISHRTYELHYIIAGIVALICACFFFCFIGFPYVKLKKAASFKSWIIISSIFAIIYYTTCFTLAVIFMNMFNTMNNYFIVGFTLIIICFLVIFLSYFLLWREVKKQWILRKKFEYLADEEQMKQVETKLATLELRRQRLVELEMIKYNKEKYSLNHLKEKNKNIYVQKPVLEEQEQEALKSSKQE